MYVLSTYHWTHRFRSEWTGNICMYMYMCVCVYTPSFCLSNPRGMDNRMYTYTHTHTHTCIHTGAKGLHFSACRIPQGWIIDCIAKLCQPSIQNR